MTEWRAIPGHPGYEVSDDGRVRSLDRLVGGRWGARRFPGANLTPSPDKDGYLRVGLGRGNGRKPISRLMLLAFVGPAPADKPLACHRDGVNSNNVLSNLYWGSNSDNTLDQVRHGTHRHVRAKHEAETAP